ncbi:hypothetical protein [Xenorhabdus szentirmaii]|uniref:hypothetical protein n=1 Tax=Xenorhabdus szentirmaii TaxID=290112 RepID=UPI0019BDE13C|nr:MULTISPECIES: hypothetical protein [unclassified Xenorhabdus]MBD2792702.1 hypothetical protein [Xenorhabdus sp. CUL]MBD2823576.1 hypothetical protein [Xenorhabdus sp. 5]
MKVRLYIFFILLCLTYKLNAAELIKDGISSSRKNYVEKNNVKTEKLSQYYDLSFESMNKNDDLIIHFLDDQCMYDVGDKYISLNPQEKHEETIEDSNHVGWFDNCAGKEKFVRWGVTSYNNGKEDQFCVFGIHTEIMYFLTWTTRVKTEEGCSIKLTATCNDGDCLNTPQYSSANDDHNKIMITLKSADKPFITSPKPNSTVENNYITFEGKGFMEDGAFPAIKTSFNNFIYGIQPTDNAGNWKGQLWMACGITGSIRIDGVENSDVTFNGPPCGAEITSIKNGQIIPAGKYSLSGIVNSDTADDDKRMQVQITGYQHDGTVYSPTKSYTPTVDTGTGKWNLDGLDAVCGINYKASISVNTLDAFPVKRPISSDLISTNILYQVPFCSLDITHPKNYEVVSSTSEIRQDVTVEGKNRANTLVDLKLSSINEKIELSTLSDANGNWKTVVKNVPLGILNIEAKSDLRTQKIKVLSSKIFSATTYEDSNGLVQFKGISMPKIPSMKINPIVGLFSEDIGFKREDVIEEVETNNYGDWVMEKKMYAARGEYIFRLQEDSNKMDYVRQGNNVFKCTGTNEGMKCSKE